MGTKLAFPTAACVHLFNYYLDSDSFVTVSALVSKTMVRGVRDFLLDHHRKSDKRFSRPIEFPSEESRTMMTMVMLKSGSTMLKFLFQVYTGSSNERNPANERKKLRNGVYHHFRVIDTDKILSIDSYH